MGVGVVAGVSFRTRMSGMSDKRASSWRHRVSYSKIRSEKEKKNLSRS